MGCLNSTGQFNHWFGNIHFSGKCNRSCYFCIGQHMPGLDAHDNLNIPATELSGLQEFLDKCLEHGVQEVNLTGTDTDPLLYEHKAQLISIIRNRMPGVKIGLRTNGALISRERFILAYFDKVSISITSFNTEIYNATMGNGYPPSIDNLIYSHPHLNFKGNVVLCPQTVGLTPQGADLLNTLGVFANAEFKRVNLREPYGQPHIGDPFKATLTPVKHIYGMPVYSIFGMEVTYWDVHYVEVESVNLYANGNVSVTYPVTKGYDKLLGRVQDQSKFDHSGRQRDQWLTKLKVVQ